MKKFWCVTSSYDDKGRVNASITDVKECEKRPASVFTSTNRKDIYVEWFESKAQAQTYIKGCLVG